MKHKDCSRCKCELKLAIDIDDDCLVGKYYSDLSGYVELYDTNLDMFWWSESGTLKDHIEELEEQLKEHKDRVQVLKRAALILRRELKSIKR